MCTHREEKEIIVKEVFAEVGITERITCAQAHEIIEKYDISFEDIAAYCNTFNIKIKNCQLGCF